MARADLAGFEVRDPGHSAQTYSQQPTGRFRVTQQSRGNPDPNPVDARKATEEQREVQDELEHQGGDPNGPGQQQSRHDIADESSR
jgi:hypothetical protein